MSGASAIRPLLLPVSRSRRIGFGLPASLVLAAGTGVTFALALSPGVFWGLGWLAPVPLLLALAHTRGSAHALGVAFTAGAVFWPLHVRWLLSVPGVHPANFGLGMLLLASMFALLGPLVRWGLRAPLGTRWAALASAWVLCDYLRLHLGFASIPWGSLAYSQIELAPLAQVASVTGLYGVTFLIVAVAAALAAGIDGLRLRQAPRGRALGELLAPALVAAAALGWGATRIAPPEAAGLQVALVQAGLYQRGVEPRVGRRQVLERYAELTRQAVVDGADLVAWPASSVPGRIPFDRGLLRWLGKRAQELETPLLVGSSGGEKASPSSSQERASANSAFLIAPSGEIVDHYDKIQLLPFNEYMPLRGSVSWPGWLSASHADARAGTRRTVFGAAGARFGVLICWENLFPDGFRSQVDQGLDFVVSMTNEAFTADPAARHQMLSMNRFRAIESGLPVIRTATTGVTAAIDRHGRMTDVVADASSETLGVVGYRVVGMPTGGEPTFYTRHGDWLPAACLALFCLAVGWGQLQRRAGAAPEP